MVISQQESRSMRMTAYLVVSEREQLFAETISVLLFPFLAQKLDDLVMALQKRVPVAPYGVRCISKLHTRGISMSSDRQFSSMLQAVTAA